MAGRRPGRLDRPGAGHDHELLRRTVPAVQTVSPDRRQRPSAPARRAQLRPERAELVAGSAITHTDTGPGGTCARLAEPGAAPAHFQEQVRARMPTRAEAEQLGLAAGVPVVPVCRTAFAADRRVVEVNSMVMDAGSSILEYDFDA
ncbi:hypothetical protein B4N89_23170 [Embleya scabrispora]|uniref:UbiC transcription regulator-associated domain-containing protein n=1 Tax=Embleya scabrispora TaxID=159449 RepID=A0A1T3P815_9ACTN|nr:hypothetical protein B4N89_23170 [Embleya scabrispora]